MKYMFLMLTIVLFGFTKKIDRPDYFDSRLNDIARKLTQVITNEDECNNLRSQAQSIAYDIEDAIKTEVNYTNDEKSQLYKLKKEAEGLSDYIGELSVLEANTSLNTDSFKLANNRVSGQLTSIVRDKYCMDVISLNIGQYVAFLVINTSTKFYVINYKWKAPNGMNSGSGTRGIGANGIGLILSNSKKKELKKIIILGITCEEIK